MYRVRSMTCSSRRMAYQPCVRTARRICSLIAEENFSVVAPYIVVTVMGHEVDAIDYADDLEEALKTANTALDEMLAMKACIQSGGIEHYASLEGIAFQLATVENMHARYSGSPSWDAHIIAL